MDNQERLAIVITAAGCIMGSLLDNGDTILLKKPRALSITPAGPGRVNFTFSELIGRPAELVCAGDATYWIPTDQHVVQTYLESISSIKIARTVPPRTAFN